MQQLKWCAQRSDARRHWVISKFFIYVETLREKKHDTLTLVTKNIEIDHGCSLLFRALRLRQLRRP